MKIALDVHGGDLGMLPNLEGALRAVRELDCGVILVGRDPEIREALRRLGAQHSEKLSIVHAPQIVDMSAEPVQECRAKPDSSMVICAELVADKKADALVSAGNSGAVMVASLLKMKRLPGVMRPAIAVPLPTVKGTMVLMDGGANMDCKPWHLAQFAAMGSIYARHVFGIADPSVGILSVGEEECKGNVLVKETIPILKKAGLNFLGPVEGMDIPAGTADVIVCDGFVGNICLKLSEGLAKTIFDMLRQEVASGILCRLGALLMKSAFRNLKKRMSPDEYGGAPLLGVNGIAVICHGRSSSTAIFNGIRVASELVRAGTNEKIRSFMENMKDGMEYVKEGQRSFEKPEDSVPAQPKDERVENL
ncbi:MAG: phosphate acyltransferase PlsX [bacterium]